MTSSQTCLVLMVLEDRKALLDRMVQLELKVIKEMLVKMEQMVSLLMNSGNPRKETKVRLKLIS